ncbi:MAG: iron-containing alcohol dehydrogenase family protein [Pyrinomonadaceae bacterium]
MQTESKQSPFNFLLRTDARFGEGVVQTLPATLESWGVKRVAIVSDIGVRTNEHVQSLIEKLKQKFQQVTIAENAVAEPDYDYLDEFKVQITPDHDVLIGIGGGSTLDVAKAVSVLVTNPGPAISYRGFDLIKQPGIPVVAIPTTAGTGSEITPNAVFTDKKEMRKLGINTDLYLPRLALLDPLMTISCPRSVTVSSGVDAIVHTIESYAAKRTNPVSRMWAREAFRLLFAALPAVVQEPNNVRLREQVQRGAFCAGIALMNSGAGPAGALSYPLGVRFNVPHGWAGGVFVSRIARFNAERGFSDYAELYDLIEGVDQTLSRPAKAIKFCDEMDRLLAQLEVPETLTHYGVTSDDVPVLAEQTMLLAGALEMNPVPFGLTEVENVLRQMV